MKLAAILAFCIVAFCTFWGVPLLLLVSHYRALLNEVKLVKAKFDDTHPVKIQEKRVISFSLYGNDTRWTEGAVQNSELCPVVFPGWTCRFYIDANTVPSHIVNQLLQNKAEIVHVADVSKGASVGRFWRYLVADDTTVDRFLVRDADSRLSLREYMAVQEWVREGQDAHIMRDHPSHGNPRFPMLAGVIPFAMKQAILQHNEHDSFNSDQNFLRMQIFPILKSRHLAHDSFSCTMFPNSRSFPTRRVGVEYVGSIFNADGLQNDERFYFAGLIAPIECRRHVTWTRG